MFDRFGYPGLFAAYNAGPARYEASLRGQTLPGETRDYLVRVARSPVIAGSRAPVGAPPLTASDRGLFAIKRDGKAAENPVNPGFSQP